MELRHIRYFLAVASEGNFTRAAAKLGISQPPLSLQIKDLEREVGAQLFRRSVHGAELTSAGQAFLEVVKVMPDLADHSIGVAQRALRGELGRLRVGFTASSAFSTVVPGAIRSFRKAHPDVEVTLEESNTAALVAGLHEGKFDAAFLRPGDAAGNDLRLRMLLEESLLVALPTAHPATEHDKVDLSVLKDDNIILFPRETGPNLYDLIHDVCRRAAIAPRINQVTLQFSSIINFVAAELGVSIVPASMSGLNANGVVFRPIKGQSPTTSLALACRKGNTSTVVRKFMAVTIDV